MEAEGLCIYCQSREADSRDHVPPKGIFPKPRPSDLVSVPACQECNGGFAQLDEEFAFWLSNYVGPRSAITARLYQQRAADRLDALLFGGK